MAEPVNQFEVNWIVLFVLFFVFYMCMEISLTVRKLESRIIQLQRDFDVLIDQLDKMIDDTDTHEE
jgi:hypothetical protein